MKIEHVALYARDLDALLRFYVERLGARPGPRYENRERGFSSYFVSFASGCRLELMSLASLIESPASVGGDARLGYAHLALSLGSEDAVDRLTEELRAAGITVLSGPRRTGDGYYESAVLDPEGNVIELTA